MLHITFTYADTTTDTYGKARSFSKDVSSKDEAVQFIFAVEKRAARADHVLLDNVLVTDDAAVIYDADYNRRQFAWLYGHIDCHRGVHRYVNAGSIFPR